MGQHVVDLDEGDSGGGSAIGFDLYNPDGTYAGVLENVPSSQSGQGGGLFLRSPNGTLTRFLGGSYGVPDGSGGLLPFTVRGDGIIQLNTSQPSTGAAPAFSGTRAGIEFQTDQQIRLLEEQARIARREGRESDARRFENDLRLLRERSRLDSAEAARERTFQERLSLLQQLTTLSQDAQQFQQTATAQAVELTGKDPLRAAISLQGGIQRGTTPTQALSRNLLSISNAQLPATNAGADNAGLRGQVEQIQHFLNASPVRPNFGLAQGGVVNLGGGAVPRLSEMGTGGVSTGASLALADAGPVVEMQRGAEGAFSLAGAAPTTTGRIGILVGENPDGTINDTTEVLAIDPRNPGEVEVIPLRATAAHGFAGEFEQATGVPSLQALSPIFDRIGITAASPIARQRAEGLGLELRLPGQKQLAPAAAFSAEAFQKLGVQPRLLRAGGQNFVVGPDGEIFAIPEGMAGAALMSQLGLDQRSFLDIGGRGELDEFASQFGLTGGGEGGGFSQLQSDTLSLTEPFNSLSTIGTPIVMPLRGTGEGPFQLGDAGSGTGAGLFLPAPEALAGLWRQLGPVDRGLVVQAYELAGIPQADLFSRMEGFSPTGSAQFGLQNATAFG